MQLNHHINLGIFVLLTFKVRQIEINIIKQKFPAVNNMISIFANTRMFCLICHNHMDIQSHNGHSDCTDVGTAAGIAAGSLLHILLQILHHSPAVQYHIQDSRLHSQSCQSCHCCLRHWHWQKMKHSFHFHPKEQIHSPRIQNLATVVHSSN